MIGIKRVKHQLFNELKKTTKAYICLVVFRQYLIGCVFSFEMVVIREPHINSMHTDNHQCFQSKTQFIFLLVFLFSYHPSVSVVSLSPPVFVFLYPLLFSFACFCFLLLSPLTTITAGTFLSFFIVCCMMILFIYLCIYFLNVMRNNNHPFALLMSGISACSESIHC